MWRRLRPLVSLFTILTFLLTLAPPRVAAADTPLTEAESISILQAYDIVRGDQNGDLNLGSRLNRASAAAIFVRVLGYEQYAQAMKDSVPFHDAKGHWGAGEIAMAEKMGLMKGDGAGKFRPESDITYVEVLTVLLRIVQKEPTGAWNAATIMSEAARLGLVPQGAEATAPALRGKIFWSLATSISRIPLPSGQTVLQRYRDAIPPQITLDRSEVTTRDATAVVSGAVVGASKLQVAGKDVTFATDTGKFTYTTPLVVGSNTITVQAYDHAGNKATATFMATRQPMAARLDVIGPAQVRPESRNRLNVVAYDNAGAAVPLEGLQATVNGSLATFDVATSTLIAGTGLGRGTITLRLGSASKVFAFEVTNALEQPASMQVIVNEGRAPAPGTDTTVKVQVLDQNGRVVTNDYFRTISLSAHGLDGLTVVSRNAATQAGVATFTIRSTAQGAGTLTAVTSGLSDVTVPVSVLPSPRIALYATNTSPLTADGAATTYIRAKLQDDAGKPVINNSGADIPLSISITGTDGQLTDSALVIRRGTSEASSGNDGSLRVGVVPGTAVITGRIDAGASYPVQSLYLPISGNLPGVQLQVTGPTARPKPGATAVPITVKVLNSNGQLVTSGSYGFQLTVSTSNQEPLVAGLPDGLGLSFQNSPYSPVPGTTNTVVGRTSAGTATVYLTYDKSGTVFLRPIGVSPTGSGYHPTAGFGPAAASSGMSIAPLSVTFGGDPVRVELTADSDLGQNQPGGAVGVFGRSMVVRARVVDQWGSTVPSYSGTITLTRSSSGGGVTRLSGINETTAQLTAPNGMAQFTVQSSGKPGFDVYTATSGGLAGGNITLSVRSAVPEIPDIAAIRGLQTDAGSTTTEYVSPEAAYMEIQLFRQEAPNPGEPHHWVTAKVYQRGMSVPIYTGAAVDLLADPPVIRVPKNRLSPGRYTYEVVLSNGAGDSVRSSDNGYSSATNAVYEPGYQLISALYDAETGRLTLNVAGLAGTGQVSPSRMRLVKGTDELPLSDDDVDVVSVSSSSIVLQLNALAAQVTADRFHGAVTLQVENGWYTSADGGRVARAGKTATVRPLAHIDRAELDMVTRTLSLYGVGLGQGTPVLDRVRVENGSSSVALRPGASSAYDLVSSYTDTQLVVKLSQTTFDALNALGGMQFITAEPGWIRVTSVSGTHAAPALTGTSRTVQVRVTMNGASYDKETDTLTLRGSGFTGAALRPDKLTFRPSGSSQTWQPVSGWIVTVVDDATLTVQWSAADANLFESEFDGRTVYLNTEPGWLLDGVGREGAPLTRDYLWFIVMR